jgi:hypothetical protein
MAETPPFPQRSAFPGSEPNAKPAARRAGDQQYNDAVANWKKYYGDPQQAADSKLETYYNSTPGMVATGLKAASPYIGGGLAGMGAHAMGEGLWGINKLTGNAPLQAGPLARALMLVPYGALGELGREKSQYYQEKADQPQQTPFNKDMYEATANALDTGYKTDLGYGVYNAMRGWGGENPFNRDRPPQGDGGGGQGGGNPPPSPGGSPIDLAGKSPTEASEAILAKLGVKPGQNLTENRALIEQAMKNASPEVLKDIAASHPSFDPANLTESVTKRLRYMRPLSIAGFPTLMGAMLGYDAANNAAKAAGWDSPAASVAAPVAGTITGGATGYGTGKALSTLANAFKDLSPATSKMLGYGSKAIPLVGEALMANDAIHAYRPSEDEMQDAEYWEKGADEMKRQQAEAAAARRSQDLTREIAGPPPMDPQAFAEKAATERKYNTLLNAMTRAAPNRSSPGMTFPAPGSPEMMARVPY